MTHQMIHPTPRDKSGHAHGLDDDDDSYCAAGFVETVVVPDEISSANRGEPFQPRMTARPHQGLGTGTGIPKPALRLTASPAEVDPAHPAATSTAFSNFVRNLHLRQRMKMEQDALHDTVTLRGLMRAIRRGDLKAMGKIFDGGQTLRNLLLGRPGSKGDAKTTAALLEGLHAQEDDSDLLSALQTLDEAGADLDAPLTEDMLEKLEHLLAARKGQMTPISA